MLGGRYRLLAPIGTGASAHVYLAEDATLRRQVAVKVLHSALSEDEAFLRRFRAEAQQAAALNHPNVMRVYDWGEADDGPYLVLEHLAGGSLRDLLDTDRRLTPAQAAQVGIQAARALDYAHRRGLVHRDIKPANLLFDDEGRLCIADFGLARALAEASWTEPTGTVLGTARYASPEQAQGGSVDGKADVYALALVLVEAVTGHVPFAADTTIATLMGRIGKRLDAPEDLGPLAPVVEQAADPDPAARPDAGQVANLLDEAARSLPAAQPIPLGDITPVADPTVVNDMTEIGTRARLYDREQDAVPAAAPLPSAGRRRRRWPFVLLAVALLLALAGGAFAFMQAAVPSHPVPNLAGQSLTAARQAAAQSKFTVRVTGHTFNEAAAKDTVLTQHPPPGQPLKEHKAIDVTVSNGPAPRPVPDLGGKTEAQARQLLADAGFGVTVNQATSETVAKGTVIDWTPKGTQEKGTGVAVTVSSGPPLVQVPDVSGQTYDAAAQALTSQGFKVQRKDDFSDTVDKGKVISTTPSGGSQATKGTTVVIDVSKGPDIVNVPDVRGMTVDQAVATIRGAGLTVGTVYGPPNARRVIDSSPTAGSPVRRGSAVDLFATR
ncbi:MAG TPA: PASTA domain-containing protein [Acidimicrobiales bacterium]|nr:PASTA domain-containing protein [Acidimicrobiales bacterium]